MSLPELYVFQNATKLISGRNALAHLAHELSLYPATRPMIVSDRHLESLGHVRKVKLALRDGEIEPSVVFTDVPADAPLESVDAAAQLYTEQACDSLVAVGGGSVLDTAKGVNMVTSTGSSSIRELMGFDRIRGRMRPFIAIPTTAGTGSEATLVAVLADRDLQLKREFISYLMTPHTAILDPEMTVTLPPRITAATGMDALVHAIEAYSGRQQNPLSRAYAAAALPLIAEYLLRAVTNGADVEARLAMANASFAAGAAFSNSMVGGVHAIGHAVGAVCGLPHGEVMSILLPHLLRYNMEAAERDYLELARLLAGADGKRAVGHAGDPETTDRSRSAGHATVTRAEALISEVEELQRRLHDASGLPTRFRECGSDRAQIPRIVEKAWLDGALLTNPRELTKESIAAILEAAW